MPQVVHEFSKEMLNKMKDFYKTSLVTPSPQGAIFRAKTEYATITAYNSGKVLFQGKNPEQEFATWQGGESKAGTSKQKTAKKQTNTANIVPKSLFTSNHIGSDETGTGDYFGPITVSAVYVTEEQIPILKTLGVQDSKNLTDPIIQKLTKEILQMDIEYSLLTLKNDKYNRLQQKGWSQGKMKAMMHHHTHVNLLKKVKDKPLDGILVDQFCTKDIYKRHLATEKESLLQKTYFMTKAESYSIAVATASLIARTRFLKEMDRLSDELGLTLLKGASNKVDMQIAEVIRKYGREKLETCAKIHFANTKKAEKYL